MPAFFCAVIGVAAALVLFGVRGLARMARHEDGDKVAEDYFTEHSGPDGGAP